MVRHCVVPGCTNSDQTALCHRFPKRKEFLVKWQRSLNLATLPAQELSRFVVCTLHFQSSDYRNTCSRMLNAMAVPSLNTFRKGAFYDTPTAANVAAVKRLGLSETRETPPPKIEVSVDMKTEEAEEEMIVEAIEEEEEMLYYLEEGENEESAEVNTEVEPQQIEIIEPEEPGPTSSNYVEEVTTTSPDKQSSAAREIDVIEFSEPQDQDEIAETIIPAVIYSHASTQTDDVQILTSEEQLQRRMAAEFYPEYVHHTQLELIKMLKERDDRLAEMTKKLTNIETAHAAMMKTMEAFKSIMN